MKLLKSKKAMEIPGALLVDIFAYIVFIALVIILAVMMSIHGCTALKAQESKINSLSSDAELNTVIINLLKTPVIIDSAELTFAEIAQISLYSQEHDAYITDFFSKRFNQLPGFYMIGISKGIRSKSFGDSRAGTYARYYGATASLELPFYDSDQLKFTLSHLTDEQYASAVQTSGT